MPKPSNVARLIAHKFTLIVIPPGSGGDSFSKALAGLIDDEKRADAFREAKAWVHDALAAVRAAPDCTYTTDEEIAGEIMRRIDETNAARRRRT